MSSVSQSSSDPYLGTMTNVMLELARAAVLDKVPAIPNGVRVNWDRLMDLSQEQGLIAWVWDSVCKLPAEQQPPRQYRISLGLSAQETWDLYNQQELVLRHLIMVCDIHHMRLLLLKGIGLSKLYPKPESRSCGDIDIYLFGDYEKGNKLLYEDGLISETRLHMGFDIKNVHVENHKLLISPNTKVKRLVWQYLQCHLDSVNLSADGYYILPPLPNLAYLLMHALNHFYYSIDSHVISVRNIMDLAIFIYRNKKELDPKATFEVLQSIYLDKAFEMIIYLSEWLLKVDLSEYHRGLVKKGDMDIIEKVIFEDVPQSTFESLSIWQKSVFLWRRFIMMRPIAKYVPRKPKNGLLYRFLKTQRLILLGRR